MLGFRECPVALSAQDVEVRDIPHLAKNERDTQISCTRYQARAACAAFIEESRMKFINANKPHRKSGV
jgi:hypothetical protein